MAEQVLEARPTVALS